MTNPGAIDMTLASPDRGDNCFIRFENTLDRALHIAATLNSTAPPPAVPAPKGKKGKHAQVSQPKRTDIIGVFSKCTAVVEQGLTIDVELSRQQNVEVNEVDLEAQCARSAQVQRVVTWSSVISGERHVVALYVDVSLALINASTWTFEEALGCGLRAVIKLTGEQTKPAAPAAAAVVAPITIQESIFHGTATLAADGSDNVVVDVAVPPFFLDRARDIGDAAGTHMLSFPVASGATLQVSVRRNTALTTRGIANNEAVPLEVSSGATATAFVTAKKGSGKNSAVMTITANASRNAMMEVIGDWHAVVVSKGVQVDLSLGLAPLDEAAGSGTTELSEVEEDAYRLVYTYLDSQPQYGLPTLKMSNVFEHVNAHDANVVRDATRRYIISARLGSPERPRQQNHNKRSTATVSHDF